MKIVFFANFDTNCYEIFILIPSVKQFWEVTLAAHGGASGLVLMTYSKTFSFEISMWAFILRKCIFTNYIEKRQANKLPNSNLYKDFLNVACNAEATTLVSLHIGSKHIVEIAVKVSFNLCGQELLKRWKVRNKFVPFFCKGSFFLSSLLYM